MAACSKASSSTTNCPDLYQSYAGGFDDKLDDAVRAVGERILSQENCELQIAFSEGTLRVGFKAERLPLSDTEIQRDYGAGGLARVFHKLVKRPYMKRFRVHILHDNLSESQERWLQVRLCKYLSGGGSGRGKHYVCVRQWVPKNSDIEMEHYYGYTCRPCGTTQGFPIGLGDHPLDAERREAMYLGFFASGEHDVWKAEQAQRKTTTDALMKIAMELHQNTITREEFNIRRQEILDQEHKE